MSSQQWISIPELARRLGVTPRAARVHVETGRIPAIRLGRTYHVRADALDALASTQAEARRRANEG